MMASGGGVARTSNDQSRDQGPCRGKSRCFEIDCFASVAYAQCSSSARAFHRFKIWQGRGKSPSFFRYFNGHFSSPATRGPVDAASTLRVFHFEGGVPETRTERAEKPMPSASEPSTRGGRLWTVLLC